MRKSLGLLVAGFWALGIAGPASSVVLDFTGSLTIEIRDWPAVCLGGVGSCQSWGWAPESNVFDTVVIAGSGAAAVNGSNAGGDLTALGLGRGEFALANHVISLGTTYSPEFPLVGMQITATNGAGAFAGPGGDAFGGVMPLRGVMKLCLFGPCSAAVTNLDIPLSVVGQGGTAFVQGVVNLTVQGAPWTTGTAALSTPHGGTNTVMGGVSPLSNTGAPSGHVRLVTPLFIGKTAALPAWNVFGVLSLEFLARECSDGYDNDGDGLFDYPSDPGCKSADSGNERPQCQDGLDNDRDGKFDFDGGASANHGVALGSPDPECTRASQNTERTSGCGLGAELALVLPLIGLAARRKRRAR